MKAKHFKTFFLALLSIAFFALVKCNNDINYHLEPLKAPLALFAFDQEVYRTPADPHYTQLQFFAYNNSYDFDGYAIYSGVTESAALAANPVICYFNGKNLNSSGVTLVQLSGSMKYSGMDCALLSYTLPAVGDWVAVRAYSGRDCSNYDSGCDNYSDVATAQVLNYVTRPNSFSITEKEGSGNKIYYTLEIDLTKAVANGGVTGETVLGAALFIGDSRNALEAAAGNDTSAATFICNLTTGASNVIEIQINGTHSGAVDNYCLFNADYFTTDYLVLARTYVNRAQYPWSGEYLFRKVP